ncbi:MAG: hypothetical protein AAB131_12210 [Actinomycetota bacterium]
MAYTQPDFRSADVSLAAAPGIILDGPGAITPVTCAPDAGGAAKTLPVGLPMCFNTSTNKWIAWTDAAGAGVNKIGVIRGFIYPVPVIINATGGNDVIGQVFTKGVIKLATIVAALTALSITTTNLNAALRGHGGGDPSPRELGFTIQDLPLGAI